MADDTEKFATKTYRCEWVAKVYPVDQYGQATKEPPYYEKPWPTHQQAKADLEAVTEPHPHIDTRRIYRPAPQGYYDTGVYYREVEIASTSVAE
ncbi:hypothetical protein [Rhizobium sp. BK176]|uniref:hypothetical protein n=1 Tax=Rhizobium sp. BK176 TaxID=2587071 RepID=UPI00216929A7|nr:hypothetical protein [Rhizobium sp. BK176]MCS4088788.1 hypothetical protein [Rhizobium sp. BK176]